MSKPIVNNKIIYNNVYGIIATHETYLNQGVRMNDSPTFANLQLTGDATIQGNLYVEGNTAIFNTNVIEVEDNIILVNRLETSSGVSLNQAGLEIERGTSDNYRIVYQESDQTTRIGFVNALEAVVVREDAPLSNGIMTWNNAMKRIDSTNLINLPSVGYISTLNSSNVSSGSIYTNGGMGIAKDLHINGRIRYNNNQSMTWSDTSFNIASDNNINLQPTLNVSIPYDKGLIFGNTSNSIITNISTNNINFNGLGNINFNIPTTKAVVLPNSVPLIFSTSLEKIYADTSSNLIIQSGNDINLVTGTNKRILIQDNISLVFGNNNQKIFNNLIGDLNINAGNNLLVNLNNTLNMVFANNTGIKLGLQRLYSDNNNDLIIQAQSNILFELPISKTINIPANASLSFGTNNNAIRNISDTLFIEGKTAFLSTQNSTSVNSGAVILSGGIGVTKDMQLGGNLNVMGNFTVMGTMSTINTETLTVKDNLITINNLPNTTSDSGIVMQITTGNYANMFYKDSTQEITFAYSNSDPNLNIAISDYISVRSKSLTLTSTTNALGLGTGGSLTVNGGASIAETLYTKDIITETLTTNEINSDNVDIVSLTAGNLLVTANATFNNIVVDGITSLKNNTSINGNVNVSGGTLNIYNLSKFYNTENATGFGSGGTIFNGGVNILKDTYITGKLTGNDIEVNNITSNNVYSNGAITINNTANVSLNDTSGSIITKGGVYVDKNIRINGRAIIKDGVDLFQNSLVDQYINASATPAWIYLGLVANNLYLKINADQTTTFAIVSSGSLKIASYGNVSMQVYLYNNEHVFVKCPGLTTTFINLNSDDITKNRIQYEGTGSEPDGTFSGYLNTWTLNQTDYLELNVGNTKVNGNLNVKDTMTVFGANPQSSNSNIGILLERSELDIIQDIQFITDTLPDQSSILVSQVKLSLATVNTNDYYNGYWIKVVSGLGINQVRQIVSYTGGTRVATLDEAWDIQPLENDIINLYARSYASYRLNELTDTFEIGYTSTTSGNILDYGNVKANAINVVSTVVASGLTSGSIVINGGLNVHKNVLVHDTITIDNTNATLSITDSVTELNINANSINFDNYTVKDTMGVLNINDTFFLNSSGNVGILTSNVTSAITLRSSEYISSDTDTGYLGLKNSSKIELYGDNSGSNGNILLASGTAGSIILQSNEIISNGIVRLTNTTESVNKASGSLILNGSIAIDNTTNSSSFTSGGAMTLSGGASIKRDLYIGGSIYVDGFIVGNNDVSVPLLTFYNTINSTINTYSNARIIRVANEITLSFTVEVIPTLASENTEIEFDLPSKTLDLTYPFESISVVSGYFNATDKNVVQNILGFAKINSIRNVIKFHSASVGIHYLQVIVKYTSD